MTKHQDVLEITVKIKSEDQTLSKKFLMYEEILLSKENPKLFEMVESVCKDFKGDIDSVIILSKMVW